MPPTTSTETTNFSQSNARRTGTGYEISKRCLDLTLALLTLVVLLPFLCLVALAIFLSDGGNPIYAQQRVGKNGKPFKFYKFRSMVRDADAMMRRLASANEHADDRTFKMKNDPRITRVGGLIRRTSIDELPQLINVLQGHMSIVGPRPPLPSEVARYSPSDWRRLAVTPGLTCIWQISGRADIPFPRQVEMDVEYVEKRCMMLDLTLIVLTIPALLTRRGAY